MNRFFVYEEYGAKYEMMMKDVTTTYRTIPQWEVFQKGFEALASSVASINSQNDKSKKALTLGDLLVKVSYDLELSGVCQLTCLSQFNVFASIPSCLLSS